MKNNASKTSANIFDQVNFSVNLIKPITLADNLSQEISSP